MKPNVGELIKNYRRERGLSQLDLEVGIGAAAGSFTRIESGKINPSKETVHKIIDFLELSPAHAVKLFGIDMSFFDKIFVNLNRLKSVNNLSEVMAIALNDVREQLGLAGGAFYLIEEDELCLKALSSTTAISLVQRIVKDPFRMLRFKIDKEEDNLLIKAVLQNEILMTNSLYEMVKPKMSKWMSDRVQKISFTQEIVALPISANSKVIGLITYGSTSNHKFSFELDLLKSFVKEIGIALEKLSEN